MNELYLAFSAILRERERARDEATERNYIRKAYQNGKAINVYELFTGPKVFTVYTGFVREGGDELFIPLLMHSGESFKSKHR